VTRDDVLVTCPLSWNPVRRQSSLLSDLGNFRGDPGLPRRRQSNGKRNLSTRQCVKATDHVVDGRRTHAARPSTRRQEAFPLQYAPIWSAVCHQNSEEAVDTQLAEWVKNHSTHFWVTRDHPPPENPRGSFRVRIPPHGSDRVRSTRQCQFSNFRFKIVVTVREVL